MKLLKTLALILCLSFVFTLVSCDDTKSSANGMSFDQCKSKVTTLMSDMVNCDEYAKIYGLPEESKGLTDKLKGTDLSKPSKTYTLTIEKDVFESMGVDFSKMPNDLATRLKNSSYSTIATAINATAGTYAMATASSYAGSYTNICTDISKPTINLLTYENGAMIMIVATPLENNILVTTGTFIFANTLDTSSASALENSINDLGSVPPVKVSD
jgi:hypothetical protein